MTALRISIALLLTALIAACPPPQGEDDSGMMAGMAVLLGSGTATSTIGGSVAQGSTDVGRAIPSDSSMTITTNLPANTNASTTSAFLGRQPAGDAPPPDEDGDGLPDHPGYAFFIPACVEQIHFLDTYAPTTGGESCFKVFYVFLIDREVNKASRMKKMFTIFRKVTDMVLESQGRVTLDVGESLDLTQALQEAANNDTTVGGGGGSQPPPFTGRQNPTPPDGGDGQPEGQQQGPPTFTKVVVKRTGEDTYAVAASFYDEFTYTNSAGTDETVTVNEDLISNSQVNDTLSAFDFMHSSENTHTTYGSSSFDSYFNVETTLVLHRA